MNSKAFNIKNGEELVQIGECNIITKQIAEQVLSRVISSLPPEQLDYELIQGICIIVKLKKKMLK